jgi:hypothetical protein
MIFMAIIIDFFLLMLMVFEQNNKTTTPVQGSGWVWQSSSNWRSDVSHSRCAASLRRKIAAVMERCVFDPSITVK